MTVGNTWPSLVSIKLRSAYVDADALLTFFIYKNISFTNFNVAEAKIAGVAVEGVLPHSGSDLAGLPSQPGALSTVYPGSKIKSLSLTSFYFGCVIFIPRAWQRSPSRAM